MVALIATNALFESNINTQNRGESQKSRVKSVASCNSNKGKDSREGTGRVMKEERGYSI
jgi:hypothetical protein